MNPTLKSLINTLKKTQDHIMLYLEQTEMDDHRRYILEELATNIEEVIIDDEWVDYEDRETIWPNPRTPTIQELEELYDEEENKENDSPLIDVSEEEYEVCENEIPREERIKNQRTIYNKAGFQSAKQLQEDEELEDEEYLKEAEKLEAFHRANNVKWNKKSNAPPKEKKNYKKTKKNVTMGLPTVSKYFKK